MLRKYKGSTGLIADPSFQLGMALGGAYGNMWAANAKKRQAEKLDDYIEEQKQKAFMDEVLAANAAEQVKTPDYQRQLQEAHNALNFDLTQGTTPILDHLYGKSGVDKAIEAIASADAKGAINFMKKQEELTPLQRAQQKYNNLDVDSVKAWAKQNGINQEVLEPRLTTLQKELSANVGNLMLPEIYDNLYNSNGDTNSIIKGIQQIDELAKYDPQAAAELKKNAVSIMQYNRTRADKLADAATKHQYDLGLLGAKANTTTSKYKVSDASMKLAQDEMQKVMDWKAENPEKEVPPQMRADYNSWSEVYNRGLAERKGVLEENGQQVTVANPQGAFEAKVNGMDFTTLETAQNNIKIIYDDLIKAGTEPTEAAHQALAIAEYKGIKKDSERYKALSKMLGIAPQEANKEIFADQVDKQAGLVAAYKKHGNFKDALSEVFG